MHTLDTQNRFLELRAKGLSLARIAVRLGVSKRTLVDWNHQHRDELRLLRAVELEALQEKILASHKTELACLSRRLQTLEWELSRREDNLKYESTRDLYHLAALVRSEIRKTRLEPDMSLDASQPANLSLEAIQPAGAPQQSDGGSTLAPPGPRWRSDGGPSLNP